ncbi:hypothetical protein [Caldimonas tepidiphila]|uniref:hypothetical protein n=1 Tax=Caldimonas tepidiphila TaxID=2315841 RepID=UPI000E5A2AF2|nr:hypothetical protein [Caldimonas tepidiphila]
MNLSDALRDSAGGIPECLAAACIDVAAGVLTAIETLESHPRPVIELLGPATAELFNGPNVTAIEALFRRARGDASGGRRHFQEIILHSERLMHLLLRSRAHPEYVLAFVCRRSANLDLALTRARRALPAIEASL